MAASLARSFALKSSAKCILRSLPVVQFQVPKCGFKKYQKPFLREMYKKRLKVGPEKLRRRSEWINWNYDSEIYAFGKRLGEDFNDSTLRQAFIHSSYIEGEKQKRADLGIDVDVLPLDLEDNSTLAKDGIALISNYTVVYLRNVYPYMFEECISSLRDYLLSDDVMSHIARHLGCEDLILSEDFPVCDRTLSETFKAVVGALLKDKGQDHAEKFVRDFVLSQLCGTDINEIWPIVNPMGLLTASLALAGRGAPEPRLLWQSASNTIMSLYWVGIYSNKELIAKSPGETVTIAEEMAAREAIKKMMGTSDNRPSLPIGTQANHTSLDRSRVNTSAERIIKNHFDSYKTENAGSVS